MLPVRHFSGGHCLWITSLQSRFQGAELLAQSAGRFVFWREFYNGACPEAEKLTLTQIALRRALAWQLSLRLSRFELMIWKAWRLAGSRPIAPQKGGGKFLVALLAIEGRV